ncbi:2736_t:CDS:2, partial [Dentiscutata heterogama]
EVEVEDKEERESSNSLEIKESKHQVINLPEIEELKHQPENLLENEELEHQVNKTEESSLLRIEELDYNSFINFLEEIKEDYEK